MKVAVVFHHADEVDLWNGAPVELAELGLGEGARELERPIAAEVEKHHRRPITNRTNGFAVGVEDDETEEVLVDHPRVLVA